MITMLSSKKLDSGATDLAEVIASHDQFFCSLIELVPADYYFPKEDVDERTWNSKYMKNTKKVKELKEHKKQLKRKKYDPSEEKTNEEILHQKVEEEAKRREEEDKSRPADAPQPKNLALSSSSGSLESTGAGSENNLSAIDGLRQRLRLRIEEMKQKRKLEAENKGDRRRKRQKTDSSSKKEVTKPANDDEGKKDKSEDKIPPTAPAVESPVEAKIEYGSLLVGGDNKLMKPKKKSEKGIAGLQKLLKKAEEKKERLDQLKKEGGEVVAHPAEWDTAVKLAQGEKLKDDPKLLKKTLKKKLKQKQKSAKEWKNRIQTVQTEKAERQRQKIERMRGNKKAQKEKKKETKNSGGEATNRPGFEGKKGTKFLNAKKPKSAAPSSS